MDDSSYGLPAERLATIAGVHVSTARRWKRRGRVPRGVARLVEITIDGDLGAIHETWRGWRLTEGALWSPEGTVYSPGEVRAIPLQRQRAGALEHQVRELMATVEQRADRLEHLDSLATLARAVTTAQAMLETLRADLSPLERQRLHELERGVATPR
jgi:hypothetical protein